MHNTEADLPSSSELFKMTGVYRGTINDIYGRKGSIEFEISGTDKNLEAGLELVLQDEEVPVILRTKPEGALKFSLNNDKAARIRCELEHIPPPRENEEEYEWLPLVLGGEFDITIQDATPYALGVVFGSIQISGDPGLGAGIFIAWLFDEN
ncbi:MAG: hypothetical protein JWP69_548 [Flaviaesturariibacter sp.]|nr:hypothetical protein [Flaviaesturariibacter sp.]